MNKELDKVMEDLKENIKSHKEINSRIKEIEGEVVLISNDHFCIIKKMIQGYFKLGITQGAFLVGGCKKEAEEFNALIEDSLSVLD